MASRVFSVPYDSGHRGLRMGAGPLLLQQHLGIPVETIESPSAFRAEIGTAFQLYGALATAVRESGATPIVLAGNCGACLGTLAGVGGRTGVIWLDAHGDFNTPDTTTSGYLDGMVLAIATGRCFRAIAGKHGFEPVDEHHVLHLGGRDFDGPELEAMQSSPLALVRTVDDAFSKAVSELAQRVDRVVFHIDMDVIDPSHGRANQYAAPDGLSPDEIVQAIELTSAVTKIAGINLCSYDPAHDPDGRLVEPARRFVAAALRTA